MTEKQDTFNKAEFWKKYLKLKNDYFLNFVSHQCTYLLKEYHFMDEFFRIYTHKDKEHIIYNKRPFQESFTIHHRLPLSAGGDNDFRNLSLMENKLHKFVHDICLTGKTNQQLLEGKLKLEDCVPNFAPVSTVADFFWPTLQKAAQLCDKNQTPLSVKDVLEHFNNPEELANLGFKPEAFPDGIITPELVSSMMPYSYQSHEKTNKRWNHIVKKLSYWDKIAISMIKTGKSLFDTIRDIRHMQQSEKQMHQTLHMPTQLVSKRQKRLKKLFLRRKGEELDMEHE